VKRKFLHLIILALLSINLCSCIIAKPPTGSTFDPKIPGSTTSAGNILSVSGASATVVNNQVLLTWNPPVIYLGSSVFKVHIFRQACLITDLSCVIDYPQLAALSSFQVTESSGFSYLDTKVQLGTNYSYWLYVEFNGAYDSGVKLGAFVPSTSVNNSIISDYSTFWQNLGLGIGFFVIPNSPMSAQTLNIGKTSALNPTNVSGKFAFGKGGSLLYVADTANNRVLVYGKQGALGCDSIADKTGDAYIFCLASVSGEPFVPLNVIGQPDQYSNKSCSEHYQDHTAYGNSTFVTLDTNQSPVFDRCLTAPTGLFVENNNLIIADTGNDRVVIHDALPNNIACDKNFSISLNSTERCAASIIVGKKDFTDLPHLNQSGVVVRPPHSTILDGESSLLRPNDVVAKDGNLYILDSGNSRIVRVKQYANPSYWGCGESTWKTPICSFSAILGQKNYHEVKTFSSELSNGNLYLDENSRVNLSSQISLEETGDYSNFLAKHFDNPSSLFLNESGTLFVSSFENYLSASGTSSQTQLKARILTFNISALEGEQPPCNVASFSASGCSAVKVLGQADINKIPVWASGFGSYETAISYGLEYVSSILTIGQSLLAAQPGNNSIKVWSDWAKIQMPGFPRDKEVLNPQGSLSPKDPTKTLPYLKSISFIQYEPASKRFFVTDSESNKIYEVVPGG